MHKALNADRAGIRQRVLAALVLGVLAIKLAYLFGSNVFMDEAYYWQWGQHLALGYYDHPPLIGWTLWASSKLFGWSVFALRAPLLLTLAADFWLLWLFARRLAPADPMPLFWLGALVFLTQPIFSILTATAVPDHLLITFGLWSLYACDGFLRRWSDGDKTRFEGLFWGSLALGLAVLSKANGALIGVGLALFILISAGHRDLLRHWQLYAAAALALPPDSMQADLMADRDIITDTTAAVGFHVKE